MVTSVKSCVRRFMDDVVDIAVVIGDDLRDLRQRAGLVDGLQLDASREALRIARIEIPTHVDPAVRLVVERGERGRLDRVDRHAFAGRQDADDPVSRHGAAFGREADRHRPLRPRIGIPPVAVPPAPWPRRPGRPGRRPSRRRAALLLVVRVDGAHDVAGKHLAAADRRQHVLDREPREPGQGAFELLVARRPCAARSKARSRIWRPRPGILPADGGAGRPADRGARLAGDDERFPGRRRRLALGADDLDLVAVLQLR